jgi:hypothetical protein
MFGCGFRSLQPLIRRITTIGQSVPEHYGRRWPTVVTSPTDIRASPPCGRSTPMLPLRSRASRHRLRSKHRHRTGRETGIALPSDATADSASRDRGRAARQLDRGTYTYILPIECSSGVGKVDHQRRVIGRRRIGRFRSHVVRDNLGRRLSGYGCRGRARADASEWVEKPERG